MVEWKEAKLGEVINLKRGYDLASSKRIFGKYPIISSSGITDFHNQCKKHPPGVITGRYGTIGKVFFTEECYWPLNTTLYVTDFYGNDPKFIFYFLQSFDFEKYSDKSTVPGINRNHLHTEVVNIPPLTEQITIASILSSLDDKIDLLHRQNATLERLAETLFRQWFVEEAKEEWEDGTLDEAIEIFDNLRVPLSRMERDLKKEGILYPYYGAAQIMDHINDYIFDGEYILLGEDGTVRTDQGFPVLQYATGKFWVNNHTHVLKAKKPYNNFFIWNYLRKKNIDEIITGAVQPKINQGNLKSLDFPRFPKNLVLDFNKLSEPIFKKINFNQTQIRTLTSMRDNLLPKLMSGEVRMET